MSDRSTHSNCPEMIHALVGEKIVGTIFDDEGRPMLMLSSGKTVLFGNRGGTPGDGGPVYWLVSEGDVRRLVAGRQQRIKDLTKEAERLMTIPARWQEKTKP